MSLADGDIGRAVEDMLRAVEFARDARDPQTVLPALACGARVFAAADRMPDAVKLVDELLAAGLATGWQLPGDWLEDFAIAALELGRGGELLEAAARTPLRTKWLDAATAFVSGNFVEAAGVYETIGSRPGEAYARLEAAKALIDEGRRAEGDVQLQRALAFWRSVGATAYTREGEALLAASA